jgi:tetratricopeptide (TPR) repeat protein
MSPLGPLLAALLMSAPVGAATPSAPASDAAFDALGARLAHADARVRRAACDTISRADDNRRTLYARRLQRARLRRHTERQRILLARLKIELPGPTGWFNIPKLKPGEKSPAEQDMLAALIAQPAPADLGRRQAYVALLEGMCILRGLGAMRDLRLAEPLVRFTFAPYGITFRWEVVRAIRGLGGYAIPGLLKLSRLRVRDWKKQRTRFLVRRFSFHLLTTMQEANPDHALGVADKRLKLLLLAAYGRFRDAEAVVAIIRLTDHADPDLRRAARQGLRAYFKGPSPRARVRRLKLPGGQESDRMQKLYLSFRERAIVETRKELERLTSGRYDRSIPGKALGRLLFAKQDERRANRWGRRLDEALQKYRQGDVAGAITAVDEILRNAPHFAGRAKLFPVLVTRAEALTLEGRLVQAATLYERAALLLPGDVGPADRRRRRIALADATYLRALQHEAYGRNGRAIELHHQTLSFWPDHLGSRVALMHLAPTPRTDPGLLWLIVLLAALGAPGLLLLASALGKIRR